MRYELRPIGRVESALAESDDAPRQGDEGAPDAWVVLDPATAPGLDGLAAGDEVILLTWLDRADRDTLRVHPRGDHARPMRGVFTTRSQHRPNPVGLHRVQVLAVDGTRLRVSNLEAFDGTPVIDIKSPLGPAETR